MKKLKFILAGVLVLCLTAMSAQASTFLDFTEAQYNPGEGSQFHRVFDVLPGINITFIALGEEGSEPYLSWYTSSNPDSSGGNDGYGVYNGGGYENDEVELPEILLIRFSDTVVAQNFYLTDFFIELGTLGTSYSEVGLYRINGGSWNSFTADTFLGNGTFILGLNTAIDSIAFTALGDIAGLRDHEFSVAGAEIAAVPVPSALLLLGSGVLGLAAFRRRMGR